MTPNTAALLARFEAAAEAAQETEMAVRKQMADEVARLERNRTFAFRRIRLLRALMNAAAAQDNEEEALAAERRAVCAEFDWSGENEMQSATLDRLQPLAESIWRCTCADALGTPDEISRQLEDFETWFEATHGQSFYSLFDRYVPQVPVVDF